MNRIRKNVKLKTFEITNRHKIVVESADYVENLSDFLASAVHKPFGLTIELQEIRTEETLYYRSDTRYSVKANRDEEFEYFDESKAIAFYNAGRKAISDYNKQPPQ